MNDSTTNKPNAEPAEPMSRPDLNQDAWFSIGPYPFHLASNDQSVIDVASTSFEKLLPFPPRDKARFVFRLIRHARSSGEVDFKPSESSPPIFQHHGHLLTIMLDRSNYATVDLVNGFGFGYVTDDLIEQAPYFRWYILEAMSLAMLAPTSRLLPLHSSCIVSNGKGVLFVGASGSGKSTLALEGAQRGHKFMGDDVIFVDCSTQPSRAIGLPNFARLTADFESIRLDSGREATTRVYLNSTWKVEVNMEAAFPNARCSEAEIGSVIMLSQERADRASLTAIPVEEALPLLEVVWPFEFEPAQSVDVCLPRLLANGVHRLTPSSNHVETFDLVDGLLA